MSPPLPDSATIAKYPSAVVPHGEGETLSPVVLALGHERILGPRECRLRLPRRSLASPVDALRRR